MLHVTYLNLVRQIFFTVHRSPDWRWCDLWALYNLTCILCSVSKSMCPVWLIICTCVKRQNTAYVPWLVTIKGNTCIPGHFGYLLPVWSWSHDDSLRFPEADVFFCDLFLKYQFLMNSGSMNVKVYINWMLNVQHCANSSPAQIILLIARISASLKQCWIISTENGTKGSQHPRVPEEAWRTLPEACLKKLQERLRKRVQGVLKYGYRL